VMAEWGRVIFLNVEWKLYFVRPSVFG
jgi:hypothetical protein